MILDENGKPIDIKPYDRKCCNEDHRGFHAFWQMRRLQKITTGRSFHLYTVPTKRRMKKKIRTLATFINNFGYSMHIGVNEIRPKEIQKLLTKVEDTPEEANDQPSGTSFDETGKVYGREMTDILDWRRIIIRILLLRSEDIRIFRSIGSSKRHCVEG